MNTMSQLNEAETKFFESRGRESIPGLAEEKPEEATAKEGTAETG